VLKNKKDCADVYCITLIDFIESKIEESVEMTGRRGGKPQRLLDDIKDRRCYWKLK